MGSPYLADIRDLTKADITVLRGKVPQFSATSKDDSMAGRIGMLIDMAPSIYPGDTVVLSDGDWDWGLLYWILPPVTIVGWGRGITRLISHQEDQAGHCGFELFRGANLENLDLIWKPKDNLIRGGQTIGIARRDAPPMIQSNLNQVDVYSWGASAFYFWGGGSKHKVRATSCSFNAGRWPVVIGDSRSADYVYLTLETCKIVADFPVYGGAGGDMSLPPNTTGLLVRGGTCVMNGGAIISNGGPNFELCLGAAVSSLGDHGYPNLPTAGMVGDLTLNNVTIRTNPDGATHVADLWEQAGSLHVVGGTGSAPDGSFIKQTGPF